LPNAVITPHVGGNTDALPRGLVDLVAEQLVRLAIGEPLHNLVKEAS
jgi:phosphoglycerate dehydrogenase-like enzyme